MTATEQSTNIKATAWTIGVHVLLFLFFIWIGYSVPVTPPAEELGMEVNLGTSEDGSGTDQPLDVNAPAEANVSTAYRANASDNSQSRELMESEDPEAPAVTPPVKTENPVRHNTANNQNTRSTNTQRQSSTTATQPQRPRYVYSGSTGMGGNNAVANHPGTSEGNTSGTGDRGVPGGTPGATNYTGSPGNGTGGISHTLSGRDISPKQFVAEFNEGGRVVVRVKVDRDGNIVSKTVRSSPNKRLSDIALQKLAQAKFSKSPDAAPEQIGDITFLFKTRSQ